MSQRILVLYASTHGHTRRIAERIGATLDASGATADVRDVHGHGAQADPHEHDAVIVGASVHAGQHQHEMLDWIRRHRTRLGGMPSAFFSVSLTAAEDTDEAHAAIRELFDDMSVATGWTPRETVAFAGALQFKEYNFATRVVMRLIARKHDPHVDVHEDTDYTDWAAVDRFAAGFAAALQTAEVPS